MDDFFSGLGDLATNSATTLVNAATSAEVAKLNAKSLRPPPPGGYPALTSPQLSTADKASELMRSPILWAVVAVLLVGGLVLVVRR